MPVFETPSDDALTGLIQLKIGSIRPSVTSGVDLRFEPNLSVLQIMRRLRDLVAHGKIHDASGDLINLRDPEESDLAKLRAVALLISDLSGGRMAVSFVKSDATPAHAHDCPEDEKIWV